MITCKQLAQRKQETLRMCIWERIIAISRSLHICENIESWEVCRFWQNPTWNAQSL